jgi:hypothetical protein
MSLNPTFALTARNPFYWTAVQDQGALFCYGADFAYDYYSLSSMYATDQFYFEAAFASNPARTPAYSTTRRW